MHNIALVAQDAQDAQDAAMLKEVFAKVDSIINAIRVSHSRQRKWTEIVEELKSEKALDNDCPVQFLQVRINSELFSNQDLPFLVLRCAQAYALRFGRALSPAAAGGKTLLQHITEAWVSTS